MWASIQSTSILMGLRTSDAAMPTRSLSQSGLLIYITSPGRVCRSRRRSTSLPGAGAISSAGVLGAKALMLAAAAQEQA